MLAPHSDIPSMVTPQFGTPYDNPVGNLLQHILNTTVATFHTAGISLPEKQYISVGTPPIDCEQLVVTWESLQRGLPRTTGGASEVLIVEGPMCAAPRTLSARIHLSRCWPTGTGVRPPDDSDVTSTAMMTALDAWTLYDSALASDIWGLGSTVVIDAGEPQGGYYTTTAALALAVP